MSLRSAVAGGAEDVVKGQTATSYDPFPFFPLFSLFTHTHSHTTRTHSLLSFESLAMFISICAHKILEEIVENDMHNQLYAFC
jgi:hypothetical protein